MISHLDARPVTVPLSPTITSTVAIPAKALRVLLATVAAAMALCAVAASVHAKAPKASAAEALTLGTEAQNAFKAGAYGEAAKKFAAAYALDPAPVYKWGVAKAHYVPGVAAYDAVKARPQVPQPDDAAPILRWLTPAKRAYQEFLALKLEGKAADFLPEARKRLAKIDSIIAETKTWKRAGRPLSALFYGGLATAIAGVGLMGGGGYLLGDVGAQRDDLRAKLAIKDADGNVIGVTESQAIAAAKAADDQEVVGGALLGVGVGVLAVGGTLIALHFLQDPAEAPEPVTLYRLSAEPFEGGLMVHSGWRF